jgi:predicted RNA-binding Zn-ribbon protein involved in translation (DUF1610 family)
MKSLLVLLLMLATGFISFAQEKAGKKDTAKHVSLYSCPMHPDVTSNHAAKCPKCGMELALSKKEQMKRDVTKSYTCPVHADVVSNSPGKCPKCGKQLTASKKEQMKMEVTKVYTCPMHPDQIADKPGKCSECGMDLVMKKSKGKAKENK